MSKLPETATAHSSQLSGYAKLRKMIKHWYQRNFGHVYLTQMKWDGQIVCWRFHARRGRVAFWWTLCSFVCRLADNGDLVNDHWEAMRGYRKPYPGWKWSYEPTTDDVRNGGTW